MFVVVVVGLVNGTTTNLPTGDCGENGNLGCLTWKNCCDALQTINTVFLERGSTLVDVWDESVRALL